MIQRCKSPAMKKIAFNVRTERNGFSTISDKPSLGCTVSPPGRLLHHHSVGWGAMLPQLQMVQIRGCGVGGGIRAETTFSHCRLHPLLTTKVIEIAFAKRVFSLINRTVAFLQIYFPIFLKKLVEEFLTNTDSSQQAGNACPCARCCEY